MICFKLTVPSNTDTIMSNKTSNLQARLKLSITCSKHSNKPYCLKVMNKISNIFRQILVPKKLSRGNNESFISVDGMIFVKDAN